MANSGIQPPRSAWQHVHLIILEILLATIINVFKLALQITLEIKLSRSNALINVSLDIMEMRQFFNNVSKPAQ